MRYLLDRLNESSTWRALIWAATAVGMNVSPEGQESILTLGMIAAGLIGALTKDQ